MFLHYNSWFKQCGNNTQPPEFVKYIVWLQALLFLSFGVVQIAQKVYPHRRRAAELAYILLSLVAKGSLGLILAVNVLMQE